MSHDLTRKHIHDLANTFSIIDASVVRALTLLTRNNPQLEDEILRLKKADEYVKKSIDILKAFRQDVHNQIAAEKK
jgi:hypothetical protein